MQTPATDSVDSSPHGDASSPVDGRRDGARVVLFYALPIFASAFLIFLVQPMVGKRILPWFGGVPAVWTLCLAFYQSALFMGYAWAHLLIRFVPAKAQPWIHAIAVAAAIYSLPILPVTPPEIGSEADPTYTVLRILADHVAFPFVVLASTGPLIQAWFGRVHPTLSPYMLYSVSNVGSFLALFAYPFVLEPRLTLSDTGAAFNVAFAATTLLVLACGWPASRVRESNDPEALGAESDRAATPSLVQAALWIGLSGTAVVILMGVTNKLCLDVASIPFLWVLPLATYLVTFIVSFSSERAYRRGVFGVAALAAFAATIPLRPNSLIIHQVIAYCALLFTTCMILHGELYRSRPSTRGLTGFYLCVSAGGAIGGLLVGIVAPLVFDDYFELPAGLVFAGAMILAVHARDPGSVLHYRAPTWRWLVAGPASLALATAYLHYASRTRDTQIHKERSFFGVLVVDLIDADKGSYRSLTNGTTVHGLQFLSSTGLRIPTAYFGRATGLGLTLTSRPRAGESRIGVVGLGVGTLAAYGREGDTMRFYEIDPVVVKIAGPGGYFRFVQDSKASVEVVVGDARLMIEDEQRRGVEQNFDILVLDAFSSDAIPIHLMTIEAFSNYFRALAPDGMMAVHVSNRHFSLMGLVSRMASEFDAYSLQIKTRPAPQFQSGLTDWVIIARNREQLAGLEARIRARVRALELPDDSVLIRPGEQARLGSFPVWTDDYSDLFGVIRWN